MGEHKNKRLQWIPVLDGVEVLVETKTKPIAFSYQAQHDEMGDISYLRQPVVTTEHVKTVRISTIVAAYRRAS